MAEKTDHIEEARKLIGWAGQTTADETAHHDRHLREAQTHAQLAIATELRGIRVAVEGRPQPSLDPDWQEFTGWCEKQIAHHEKELATVVNAVQRESHSAARDAFVDARDRVIHGE